MQTNSTVTTTATPYTLREAVIEAVTSIKSNGSFTVHQVTVAVRDAVNNGDYSLPGLENPDTSAAFKYAVDNNDVRDVLNVLNSDGTLASLGVTDVDYSGKFRIYKVGTAVASTNSTPASPAPVVAVAAPSNPPTTNRTDAEDDSDVSETDSPVAQHLAAYLTNRNAPATLKQIQSALKKNGLSCQDLAALCKGLGYTVNVGTEGKYSTYTVSAN
jgi:hypothetical protein